VDFFRHSTRINPAKAKYWSHLSFALSKIPKRVKEAEEALLKAIDLEPDNANYHIQLGKIYLDAKITLRAIRQFEAALSCDPDNGQAKAELEKLKGKTR
jgi:tetratricopeptide (TPR) repeat protein